MVKGFALLLVKDGVAPPSEDLDQEYGQKVTHIEDSPNIEEYIVIGIECMGFLNEWPEDPLLQGQ